MAAKNLLSKRIPTVLGLVLLAGGLISGVFLVGKTQLLSVNAGPTAVPRNVRMVNAGANSITITWTTDSPVVGFVKYSDNPGKLTLTGGDTRDQRSGSSGSFTTHYVEVVGLSANKNYYFEVGSGGAVYDDGGKPYQSKTTALGISPNEDMISGKVLSPSGLGAGGVIVYVEMDGSETLAALTKDDGAWRLPLSAARDKQGGVLSYDAENMQLTIFAQGGNVGTATALTNTNNDSPVPDITLGKTHNFIVGFEMDSSENDQPVDDTKGFSTLVNNEGSETLENSPEATLSVKLINPEFNGESIATTNPEIKGDAPAGTVLIITVNSQEQQVGSVTAGESGKWSYTPPAGLEPGNHTITIEYQDQNGILQKLTRHFVVIAADNANGLPAFTATPSATPEVSPTTSPTPTVTVSPSPNIAVSPSTEPTTNSGETSEPATSSGLPNVGVLTPTYTLLISGLGLFLGGLLWKRKIDSLINTR